LVCAWSPLVFSSIAFGAFSFLPKDFPLASPRHRGRDPAAGDGLCLLWRFVASSPPLPLFSRRLLYFAISSPHFRGGDDMRYITISRRPVVCENLPPGGMMRTWRVFPRPPPFSVFLFFPWATAILSRSKEQQISLPLSTTRPPCDFLPIFFSRSFFSFSSSILALFFSPHARPRLFRPGYGH